MVNEQQKVQDEKKEVRKRKAMAPRSDVWDNYHKILIGGMHTDENQVQVLRL